MNSEIRQQLQEAISYSFLLLKYRLRSEAEIRRRLKRKKFPTDIIETTVSFLKNKNFINDREFAHLWFDSRIKRLCGIKRIKQELKIKGISEELIREAQEDLQDYDEKKVVLKLAKKRLLQSKGLEINKKRQRLYGYLIRRGFPAGIVIEVLNKVLPVKRSYVE